MGKSNYPNKIDTSAEIPTVRDNILEQGSDAINAIKSAIINIERTLGINPQGATGNTVAERLNKILDGNGNILQSALDRSNVLSGPITNNDISKSASIDETKLNLNFPTKLLQAEISQIANDFESIIAQIEELNNSHSLHINTSATNRHPATAISVSAKSSDTSDESTIDIESSTVQLAIEDIYNKHINYSGENISSDNRSHTASQIFFDKSEVTEIISSSDVQNAIIEVTNHLDDSQVEHQSAQHSNGVIRRGGIVTYDSDTNGERLVENVSVSFDKSSGTSTGRTTITFDTPISPEDFNLEASDIITLSDSTDDEGLIEGRYEISKINLDGTDIESVEIFGLIGSESSSKTLATVSKNTRITSNKASLLASVRQEADATSAQSIQICNPNAVRVISSGCNPSLLSTSQRFINIQIDDDDAVEIDLYDGTIDKQTIDSIVARINEQCAEQALPILSYRLEKESGGTEYVIAHNLPDEGTTKHTITISDGSDDGIEAAGFSYIKDNVVSSVYGTEYFINGTSFTGLLKKLDSKDLVYFTGTTNISTGTSDVDFLELGIKIGDILTIVDAPDSSDNGSFVITNVTENQIELSVDQLPSGFAQSSDENVRFIIYDNIASVQSETFSRVDSTFGSMLIDVFLDSKQQFFYHKRLEYRSHIVNSESIIDIVDFDGDVAGKELELTIQLSGNNSILISLDSGDSFEVCGYNNFVWIESGEFDVRLKLQIPDVGNVISKINSDGANLGIVVYGFAGVNTSTNLLIGRACYNNSTGRFCGGIDTPRVISLLDFGNITLNEISTSAIKELVHKPVFDLRSNGVIFGLDVGNASKDSNGYYTFSLARGVCYVAGKRFEIDYLSGYKTDILAAQHDKIFIAIDEWGNLIYEAATSGNCNSPFKDIECCLLATIEFDNIYFTNIDLRLFISDIDLKILNSITVSPEPELAHFTSISKALKYAKRFTELYPDAGIPTIHLKSGTHTIEIDYDYSDKTYASWASELLTNPDAIMVPFYDEQIRNGFFVDFGVTIEGEGDSTVVQLINNSTFSNVAYSMRMPIVIPGDAFSTASIPFSNFNSGLITFRNFKLKNSRIAIIDNNIYDGSTALEFWINVDNITFDFTDFTANAFDTFIGPRAIALTESDDTSNRKGNITVSNCRFMSCYIYPQIISRLGNINIVNNTLIGTSSDYLLYNDIYTFGTATNASNINIYGNIHASNNNTSDSGSGPNILRGGISRWGDRISRDVRIGSNLYVSATATVTTSVTSASFAYSSTKTFYKNFTWEGNDPSYGPTIASAGSLTTHATGGITWAVAEMDSGESANIRIAIPNGCNLSALALGISDQSSSTSNWTIRIYELSRTGGGITSVYGPTTVTGAAVGTAGAPDTATFSGINLSPTDENIYYVQMSHNSGSVQRCYYVRATYTTSNVEDAIGFA